MNNIRLELSTVVVARKTIIALTHQCPSLTILDYMYLNIFQKRQTGRSEVMVTSSHSTVKRENSSYKEER